MSGNPEAVVVGGGLAGVAAAVAVASAGLSTLHLAPKGVIKLDFEDEITRDTFMTHAGEIKHAPTAKAVG